LNQPAHISRWCSIGLVLLLFAVIPKFSFAQQDPVYTQYLNNMLTIQPAYAGLQGNLTLTALSRAQWVGWEGAPNTNTISGHFPLKTYNVGLGASFINDKWGPIRQNSLYVDYAYRVRTRPREFLSFGIKGGFNIYQARLTDLEINDPIDPIFATDVNFRFMPNFGLGILWHSDRFFIGASSPKILKNDVTDETSGVVYREVMHIYAMGGYVFFLSDNVKFKPTYLYRWAERTPSTVDISANLLFYDRFWAGATYRFENSYGLLFQFRVNTQLTFGYAYDLTTFHEAQVNSGTHEFMISYDFVTSRRSRSSSPRYF
jgi:type IX secretion system PorP/SprF family membrane protein